MFDFLRFYKNPNVGTIDFLKYSWLSAILSFLILTSFFGVYIYRYYTQGQTFNYSVDFTGGIQTRLKFNKPVTSDALLKIMQANNWPNPVTREFTPTEFLVRVKKEAKDVGQEAENIRKAIEDNLKDGYKVEIVQTDSVGSATGDRLWTKSFYAIMIALVLMLIYIALRFFSFAFAMGAVVSLFHDAVAILAVFLLFDKEISINVIGAILAVLGYSINDTIVIFAKVRDNLKKYSNLPVREVINLSITQTLSRTILTTFATLLVVAAILIFGGDTLRDLALALFIGILFGIYSTIFIANPVLLMLYKNSDTKEVPKSIK